MEFYWIIAAVAAAVILIAFLSVFLHNLRLRRLGIDGERKVAKVLKRFAGIRSYKVINDLYLPLYDKTTQIDHVLIGFFGILVIETKNVKGELYGDPRKKNWLHIVGGERHELYNPLMQNQTHIDCMRHIFAKEKIYNQSIESLIVFTNKKLSLNIPNKLPIIMLKKLPKFLRQERFEKDNNVDVDAIEAVLMKYKVTDKALLAAHNKNVKEMAKANRD